MRQFTLVVLRGRFQPEHRLFGIATPRAASIVLLVVLHNIRFSNQRACESFYSGCLDRRRVARRLTPT